MNKKILIVGDDLTARNVGKKFLGLKGFDILEADNAKDGFTLAIANLPDLVIMDIRLPCKKKASEPLC